MQKRFASVHALAVAFGVLLVWTGVAAQGDIVGVWHSHTHTDPYPSPTDVRQAVDPMWIYVIVSLRDEAPMLRAYRIRDEQIAECAVVIDG